MKAPDTPSFEQKGLRGYRYPLKNPDVEIYRLDVSTGHDTIIRSKKCLHLYYIVEGEGRFLLDEKEQQVRKGDVVEVPPDVKYCYSGTMTLLLIMHPPWFAGNEEVVGQNPDVK